MNETVDDRSVGVRSAADARPVVKTAANPVGEARVVLTRLAHRSRRRSPLVILDQLVNLVWLMPGRVSGDVLVFRHVTHPCPVCEAFAGQ